MKVTPPPVVIDPPTLGTPIVKGSMERMPNGPTSRLSYSEVGNEAEFHRLF